MFGLFPSLFILLLAGVVLLTMHQYSQPIGECITDLNSIQPEIHVAPLSAIRVITNNGLVELCNVAIAFFLFRFTGRKEAGDFMSRSYVTASALIPLCLGLFYNSERTGCILDAKGGLVLDGTTSKTERQFPVAILFHLIVTGCVNFMKIYMDQCDRNLAAVTRLHKELSSKNSKKKK